jgi:hypothetical protein
LSKQKEKEETRGKISSNAQCWFSGYIPDLSNGTTKNLTIYQSNKDEKEENMVCMDILCTINRIRVIVLFDSGANISVVDQSLIKQHN